MIEMPFITVIPSAPCPPVRIGQGARHRRGRHDRRARGAAGAAVGAAAASGARLGGRCGRASSRRGECRWAGVGAWPTGALRCGCACA